MVAYKCSSEKCLRTQDCACTISAHMQNACMHHLWCGRSFFVYFSSDTSNSNSHQKSVSLVVRKQDLSSTGGRRMLNGGAHKATKQHSLYAECVILEYLIKGKVFQDWELNEMQPMAKKSLIVPTSLNAEKCFLTWKRISIESHCSVLQARWKGLVYTNTSNKREREPGFSFPEGCPEGP